MERRGGGRRCGRVVAYSSLFLLCCGTEIVGNGPRREKEEGVDGGGARKIPSPPFQSHTHFLNVCVCACDVAMTPGLCM